MRLSNLKNGIVPAESIGYHARIARVGFLDAVNDKLVGMGSYFEHQFQFKPTVASFHGDGIALPIGKAAYDIDMLERRE